jgi:predicted ATPase
MIPIPAPVDRRRDRAVRPDHAAAAAALHGPLQSLPVRLDELETLGALVDQLAQGKGSIAAVAGEPGIGKSRTAQALADLAAARGTRAYRGRCTEEPGAPPYWPWTRIVERWVAACDDEGLRRILGSGARPIAEVVPAIPARLGDLPPLTTAGDPIRARFLLFDAISGFLRRAAAHSPLLLIIDDMHWADASSLRLLEFLAANLGDSPLMLLITYRDIAL